MKTPRFSEEILQKLQVALVYHFGSSLQGSTTPLSDMDIGIVFTTHEALENSLDRYTRLYDLLTDSFQGPLELDIVFLQQTPPAFQYHVIRNGKILYQCDPTFRANYEEQVTKEYLDFEPILRQFNQALLAR